MQAHILELLKKKEGYVSGEEISRHLNISRQALWKHIQELREAGYDIVAVPHLGYQLVSCPDRLFSFEISRQLNTKIIAKKIFYFDTVSSTMDIAVKLGIEGAPEGTLVVAETQEKGRGRLRREWLSPKHKGIYVSLLLRPEMLPNDCSLLTLLTAVSVCEAVKEKTGLDIQIKWPNDLLLHNKKVGGILTELNAEMDITSFIVIGIGLNINTDKGMLIPGATSLKEHTREHLDRIQLLQALLRKLEEYYFLLQSQGSGHILEKWRLYAVTLGKRVKVVCQRQHLEGEAIDIDTNGGLLIRNDSGLIEKVMAGDIVHCR